MLYVHSVTLRGQFAYITVFTAQHVAGQNKENTLDVAVLTVQATRTCLWGDVSARKETLFVKLLTRANAETVARHTTHLTYETNIFIVMTFGLFAPRTSLTAPNITKLLRM